MIRYLAVWFCCAVSSFAAEPFCPWLDAATAGGILGGPVTSKVTATSCEFVRPRAKLRIEVHKLPTAREELAHRRIRCGASAEPLKAVGNEAFLCSKSREVVGRVRDAIFTIRLSTSAWKENAKQVAEQIAGVLF